MVKAFLNGGGLINMVVRRRKSLGGRLLTPVHINLVGHQGIWSAKWLGLLCLVSLLSLVAVNASVLFHPFPFSLLSLRQWYWSGERCVCHCPCPGQSSSQGRLSHSWRQTDRCESFLSFFEILLYNFFFILPPSTSTTLTAHTWSFAFLIQALFHSSIHTPNPDKVGFGREMEGGKSPALIKSSKACSSRGLRGAVFKHIASIYSHREWKRKDKWQKWSYASPSLIFEKFVLNLSMKLVHYPWIPEHLDISAHHLSAEQSPPCSQGSDMPDDSSAASTISNGKYRWCVKRS